MDFGTWYRLKKAPILLMLAAAVVGCGKPKENVVRVKGRLTDNGQPLVVQRPEIGLGVVKLEFWPANADPNAEPFSANADKEGNYTVSGLNGNGIAPGKYRIAVYQWDPYPNIDRLKSRFSLQKTPIIRDITGEPGQEVTIDIDLAQLAK